eukprot:CAMPEP_0184689026 /NCGR_PEP_ID=MMETSP0312-20130426/30270_1 /TAXON_ID=31354 /ORGANISM="Compsopogon coeruleus, Strain SAG 36.94" /LENGTH=359 /DNA_ID=CAMNT_0027146319 /DNA_START=540 /DNA_END=1619 /DNA_ORIENTATION=+
MQKVDKTPQKGRTSSPVDFATKEDHGEQKAGRENTTADEVMVKQASAKDVDGSVGTAINEGRTESEGSLRKGSSLREKLNAMAVGEGQNEIEGPDEGPAQKRERSKPSTQAGDSVAAALAQAIRSKDTTLLEKSLNSVHQKAAMDRTILRLPADAAAGLLDALVLRFQSNSSRASVLINWLRSLMIHHAGSLMSNPEALKSLRSLQQAIEERVTSFDLLLGLEGRLDLIVSQSESIASRAATGNLISSVQPLVEYMEVDGLTPDDKTNEEHTDPNEPLEALSSRNSLSSSDGKDAVSDEDDSGNDDDSSPANDNDGDSGSEDEPYVAQEVERQRRSSGRRSTRKMNGFVASEINSDSDD